MRDEKVLCRVLIEAIGLSYILRVAMLLGLAIANDLRDLQ